MAPCGPLYSHEKGIRLAAPVGSCLCTPLCGDGSLRSALFPTKRCTQARAVKPCRQRRSPVVVTLDGLGPGYLFGGNKADRREPSLQRDIQGPGRHCAAVRWVAISRLGRGCKRNRCECLVSAAGQCGRNCSRPYGRAGHPTPARRPAPPAIYRTGRWLPTHT